MHCAAASATIANCKHGQLDQALILLLLSLGPYPIVVWQNPADLQTTTYSTYIVGQLMIDQLVYILGLARDVPPTVTIVGDQAEAQLSAQIVWKHSIKDALKVRATNAFIRAQAIAQGDLLEPVEILEVLQRVEDLGEEIAPDMAQAADFYCTAGRRPMSTPRTIRP